MNYPLVARLLGMLCWLMGATMLASIPWCFPALGGTEAFEWRGFQALAGSLMVCAVLGVALRWLGRHAKQVIYRKEALGVVGLSWLLATFLGALPYFLSGTALGMEGETPLPMTLVDCLFESQSGFSTTGATVLTDVENPNLVPRSILFWRSSTQFLGGLGIIVLFVAILGQGSAGKALMRAEMPGPSKEGSQERMQHTAWIFAAIYIGMNLLLTVLLLLEGMSLFDALNHAMATLSTGGFSTRNASIGHYNSELIEYTILAFMIIGGMNFVLIYYLLIGRPRAMWRDIEWRTYWGLLLAASLVIIVMSMALYQDFNPDGQIGSWQELRQAVRYVTFQVASIMTTTGFGTHDYDQWHQAARSVMFLLMFVGGCAGSTAGGMKVIRHLLFIKILGLEIEKSYRPTVVRPLTLGSKVLEDPQLKTQVLLFFGLISFIFMLSWITLVTIEPDSTWTDRGQPVQNKLIDSASAVAATLNNIGPGLGTVGAKQNYAAFSLPSKLLFILLMMLGRLELFAILVLFLPGFWRSR